jgi:hypothetical protein
MLRPPAPTSKDPDSYRRLAGPTTIAWILAFSAFVAALFGWGRPCSSQAVTEPPVLVLLLRPLPTSDTLAEAILRIKSELRAGGFDVAVEDIQADAIPADPSGLVQRSGEGLSPSATVGIFGDLDRGPVEMWVVDRITGKSVLRRIMVDVTSDRRICEVLAIRAQEILHASLVERLLERERRSPAATLAPPELASSVERAVRRPGAHWRMALEAGGAALAGFGGVGPSLAPTVRFRVGLSERFALRLTGLGFGTRPVVTSGTWSAQVGQSLLLLEGVARWRPDKVVRPMLSVGAGSERISVEGRADAPYRGESNARWFLAGDAGAGLAVRLHSHWELQIEAHALFTTPRPAVNFFDIEAARTGQPTLMAIVSLAGGA